jgi:hypothetical protein
MRLCLSEPSPRNKAQEGILPAQCYRTGNQQAKNVHQSKKIKTSTPTQRHKGRKGKQTSKNNATRAMLACAGSKKTKGKRKEHAVSQNPKTPLLYAAEIAPKVTSSIHLNIHWQ